MERAFDASGSDKGRLTAIQATRKWGKIALVGEGGTLGLKPSPDMIHDQKTVYGSWVTSIWLMEDLVERIVRWKIHPEDLVTTDFHSRRRTKPIRSWPAASAARWRSSSMRSLNEGLVCDAFDSPRHG